MNWDSIGAISELIGAAGVVISLVYLSIQIRRGAKSSEDAAFRDIFASTGDHMRSMIDAPNRQIILKGLVNYGELDSDEKFAFDGLFGIFLTMVESSIISNAAELVKDQTLDNWGYYLRTRYFGYGGFHAWWEDSRDFYIPELQEWIDAQIGRADDNSDFWNIR